MTPSFGPRDAAILAPRATDLAALPAIVSRALPKNARTIRY
jgi:hypothetical protein